MKKLWMLTAFCAAFATSYAYARDTIGTYSVDQALRSEPGKVGDDIALYFAGQPHPLDPGRAVAEVVPASGVRRAWNQQRVQLVIRRRIGPAAQREGVSWIRQTRAGYSDTVIRRLCSGSGSRDEDEHAREGSFVVQT